MTAVEFLVLCISDLEYAYMIKKIDPEEYGKMYQECIEEAKKMENHQQGYTKEQVREAIDMARHIRFVTYSDDDIIQSLKQPKQD